MPKRSRRRSDSSTHIDHEFLAALEEEDIERRAPARQLEHRTRQFCAQVKRILNVVLASRSSSSALDNLSIDEVLAVHGCSRLIVRVAIPADCGAHEALAKLRALTPWLRSELARSISRKRVPELSFIPAVLESDRHE